MGSWQLVSVVVAWYLLYCTGNPSYLSHLARPLHLRLRLFSCAGEGEFGWRAAAMSMAPNIFATALTAEPTVGTGFKAVKRGSAAAGGVAAACWFGDAVASSAWTRLRRF